MRVVGVIFGCVVAALFAGISLAMVWQYGLSRSETLSASYTMAALGVVAILYSMGGITFSKFLEGFGRKGLAQLALAGVVLAEGAIVFCELGFHGINIKATELRRAAQSIEVGVSQEQVENSRRVIQELRDVRSSKEINADIALELAQTVRNEKSELRPLSIVANGCVDESSPFYAKCGKVLKLRGELARAAKFEAAQVQLGTTTAERLTAKASVNAGAEVGSDMTGFSTAGLSHTQLWFMLGFLMVGRLTTVPVIALCLSLRDEDKHRPASPSVELSTLRRVEAAPVATIIEPDAPPLPPPVKRRLAVAKPKEDEIEPAVLRRRLEDLILPGGLLPFPEAKLRIQEMVGESVTPQRASAMLKTISIGEPRRIGRPAVTYYPVGAAKMRALA